MRISRLTLLASFRAAAAPVAVRHALAAGHSAIGVASAAVGHSVTGMLIGLAGLGCPRAVTRVLALGLLSRMAGMIRVGVGGRRSLRDRGSSGRHRNRNEKHLHH